MTAMPHINANNPQVQHTTTARDGWMHLPARRETPSAWRSSAQLLRDEWLSGQPIPTRREAWGGLPCLNGRYVVHAAIVRGPVFQLYRAWDTRMEREVALKVLTRQITHDDTEWQRACQRFSQEALAMMMAHQDDTSSPVLHNHLIRCYGMLRTPRAHYIAMEYLEGCHLRQWTSRYRPNCKQVLTIARGLSRGLQLLHNAGMIHRDIKPENVMVTNTGRVVLIDLGIAVHFDKEHAEKEADLVKGTPGYLAPEQLFCQPLSKATDIYAIGALLYELMTGECLFPGRNTQELLMAQMSHRIPSMHEYAKDPAWCILVPLIQRCLQQRPTQRFASLEALWESIGVSLTPS